MDRKPQQSPEILRLVRLGEASRACLDAELAALRHRLDVPARLRDSLKHHPGSWVFGSLGAGLIASFALRRRSAPVVRKRRGIAATLMGLTLTAARPLAKVWLADQLKQWLAGRSGDTLIQPFQPNPKVSSNHVHPQGPRPR